jgi:hypothetical protein
MLSAPPLPVVLPDPLTIVSVPPLNPPLEDEPDESDVILPGAPAFVAAARVRFAPARIDNAREPVVERVGFGDDELRRKLSTVSDGVATARANPLSCVTPPPEDAP